MYAFLISVKLKWIFDMLLAFFCVILYVYSFYEIFAQNAGNCIYGFQDFKIINGSMPLDPHKYARTSTCSDTPVTIFARSAPGSAHYWEATCNSKLITYHALRPPLKYNAEFRHLSAAIPWRKNCLGYGAAKKKFPWGNFLWFSSTDLYLPLVRNENIFE